MAQFINHFIDHNIIIPALKMFSQRIKKIKRFRVKIKMKSIQNTKASSKRNRTNVKNDTKETTTRPHKSHNIKK